MHPGNGVAPPQMSQNQQYQQQQQQPWMMAPQQQQPMWNQQPQIPLQQQFQQPPPQQQQYAQPSNPNEIRTLWIGDLQPWMDENYVYSCFAQTNEVVNVKLIRNKQTSVLEGYGFVEFASRAAAESVLQNLNGTTMPSVDQNFRLNWASFSAGERRNDDTPEYSIFVGDLAPDVTDYLLQETFRQHYPSVKGAKVVTDKMTGRTKGYGFVKFGDEGEQQRAMNEMNGQLCSSRAMRIGAAASKNTPTGQQFPKVSYHSQGIPSENDPNNTTIFVGGLDPNVSDDALKQVFGQYGEIIHVKIPVGKGCGFVQFADRSCAEQALLMLNGTPLGSQSIRLSWGRSQSNRQNPGAAQPQADPNSWNNGGYYGYGNGYEAYGYAPAVPQDPNMYYAGGYPGYGNYQQPPQQQ